MTQHSDRLEHTLSFVRGLHGDTSVPLETTKESLETVRDEVLQLIEAVETDLENQ